MSLNEFSGVRPLFGPSGHSESYAAEGHVSTMDMPAWLAARGLDIFEYSFGRGVRISSSSAADIGAKCDEYGIEMSVHAPYFINFASPEPEKAQNSVNYILSSLKILKCFGGERCVFHAGAQGKDSREAAFARTKDMFRRTLDLVAEENAFHSLILCPETMGKQAQIGTVEEVIAAVGDIHIVALSPVNALYGGSLKEAGDFELIVRKLLDGLGEKKTRNMQVHFSKIQYGAKGEIRHLTFADEVYGPRFEPFAEVIVKYGLTPHILSESAGTQAEDAAVMRDIWKSQLTLKNQSLNA